MLLGPSSMQSPCAKLCESNCWTSLQTTPRSDGADVLVNGIRINK